MGIYSNIEKSLNDMVYNILQNEDLCKLLYYNDYDPLSKNVVDNPDRMIYTGGDVQEEEYHRIFLTPKIPTVTDNKKTIIVPRILRIKPSGEGAMRNVYYKEFSVIFDIMTHVSLWVVKDNHIRVLQIADLIDTIYNLKYTDKSIQNPFSLDTVYIYPSEQWCGYRLEYRFTNWSGDKNGN